MFGNNDSRKKWRALLLVIVLVTACIVVAHSLVNKSNAVAEPALWGPEMDSLAALDDVATEVDTVFILISSRQQGTGAIVSEIEAATRNLRARGNRASAFRLKKGAVDYENLAEQFSVPTVLAMVKGCGHSAVSGQITEAKLLEAFATASTAPPACCPPGTDPSQCDPSNSQ